MKFNFYRILTIVMAVVLLFAIAVNVAAVNKKTATQDGLYVVFTTDKDEYAADETVKVNLQIINNAAAKVDLQSQITFPESIQVAAGSAEQTASIEVGSVWDADELTLKYEKVAASAGKGSGWLIAAIIGGVVVVAAVVFLLIYGKKPEEPCFYRAAVCNGGIYGCYGSSCERRAVKQQPGCGQSDYCGR